MSSKGELARIAAKAAVAAKVAPKEEKPLETVESATLRTTWYPEVKRTSRARTSTVRKPAAKRSSSKKR